MSFSDLEHQADEAFSEINMTPLVDVMLVLLIIFMVTMPVLTQAVKVNLPQTSTMPAALPASKVNLSIDANGQWFWEKTPLSDADMQNKLQALQTQVDTQINLHADQQVTYQRVAALLAMIQSHGLSKVALAVTPQS